MFYEHMLILEFYVFLEYLGISIASLSEKKICEFSDAL